METNRTEPSRGGGKVIIMELLRAQHSQSCAALLAPQVPFHGGRERDREAITKGWIGEGGEPGGTGC